MFGKPSATIVFPKKLDSLNPIEVSDPLTSLEAAFVERYAIESLSQDWKRDDLSGIYLLLSDHVFTNSFRVLVGCTHRGFEGLLQDRNEDVGFWSTAMLFCNHDGENLTVEQAEELKNEIIRLLQSGHHIQVDNDLFDNGQSLKPNDQEFIEDMALFVIRMMFLQGYRSGSLAKAVKEIEDVANDHSEMS